MMTQRNAVNEPHLSSRRNAPRHLFAPTLVLFIFGAMACEQPLSIPTTHAKKVNVVVSGTPPAGEVAEVKALGSGWYANVEVDAQDVVHVAYTDADSGDVFYATSDIESLDFRDREAVEVGGAVGSYLQLALGPAATPVLSYYHQDQRTLRLAHRRSDLAKMKEAGGVVDLSLPKDRDPTDLYSQRQRLYEMGPGWTGEDVTFGDDVGIAGRLVIDGGGFPHLTYAAVGKRMRYARRERGAPAFGTAAMEKFELLDVDAKAGSAFTMGTGLAVSSDLTVTVSYCNWNFVDAQLKIATLKRGETSFDIRARPLSRGVDGWHSDLVAQPDGRYLVFAFDGVEKAIGRSIFAVSDTAIAEATPLFPLMAAFRVQVAPDGTTYMLVRGQKNKRVEGGFGLWFLIMPDGDPKRARRIILDEGKATDGWIDLALRPGGKPVAVWTQSDRRAMKIYVHP